MLVVATGVLFGVWMQPLPAAAAWTFGMLCIHAAIIRNCSRFLAELFPCRDAQMADAVCAARSAHGSCWTAPLIHPAGLDAFSNALMMFLMLLAISVSSMLAASLIAALAATAPVTVVTPSNFALGGTFAHRRVARDRSPRPPPSGPSPALDNAGDAGGARRKGRADPRSSSEQAKAIFRRGAASRRVRQRLPSRASWRR